ncbi:MAG TPA: acyl carrier protein [Actinocrinis sp.]|nr:acyl carrier protein [Actinocrinis sp.]
MPSDIAPSDVSSAVQLVQEVVGQLLDVEAAALTAERRFAEIEGWDSVNALRILVYLEREVGGSVDFERFTKADTIGELAAVVHDAQAAAA